MRIREFEVTGRVLVTTLLDPHFASARELDDCYALRWITEVDWRTIKDTMAMDVLRCQSSKMVRTEISVHLLAYNPGCWFMATAAKLADVQPRVLGFIGAKCVLSAFVDELRRSLKGV